ncbi:MAG: hypothetical protein PGN25_05235 [Methylorubrum populi]
MIPPDVSDKLTKLIPLLGSDKDGEALGAARAIGRTLKSAGLDLHALAGRIGPQTTEAPRVVYRDVPYATPSYNYADAFRRARPPVSIHEPADALTRSFGLPIYTEERLAPGGTWAGTAWNSTARSRESMAVASCATSSLRSSGTSPRAPAPRPTPRRLGWRRWSLAAIRRALRSAGTVQHDRARSCDLPCRHPTGRRVALLAAMAIEIRDDGAGDLRQRAAIEALRGFAEGLKAETRPADAVPAMVARIALSPAAEGEDTCPTCAGRVRWAKDAINGHIHARCEAVGCFVVME